MTREDKLQHWKRSARERFPNYEANFDREAKVKYLYCILRYYLLVFRWKIVCLHLSDKKMFYNLFTGDAITFLSMRNPKKFGNRWCTHSGDKTTATLTHKQLGKYFCYCLVPYTSNWNHCKLESLDWRRLVKIAIVPDTLFISAKLDELNLPMDHLSTIVNYVF